VLRHLLSCVDPVHCWLMSRIRTRCTAAKSWPRRVRRRARPFQLASCVMTHAIAPPAAVANGNSSAAKSYRSFSPRCTYAATFGDPASSEDELAGGPLRHDQPMSSGVPVQYFQSIIAIQLAVAGALLFQLRFFDTKSTDRESTVDPRIRLLMVLVITATLFASLEAMREDWGSLAAALITAGLALSLLPIVLRGQPAQPGTADRVGAAHPVVGASQTTITHTEPAQRRQTAGVVASTIFHLNHCRDLFAPLRSVHRDIKTHKIRHSPSD
jgi:hypothetical protein